MIIALTVDGVQLDNHLSIFFGNCAIFRTFDDIHMTYRNVEMCLSKILHYMFKARNQENILTDE